MCRPEETNVKWCLVPLILAFSSSRTIPTDLSKNAPSQRWQRRMSCCPGTRLLSDVFSRPFILWQKYHLKRITGVCYSRRGLKISEVFQLTKLSKTVNIVKSHLVISTKLKCKFHHRRSTTVSLETFTLYSLLKASCFQNHVDHSPCISF